MLSQNRNLLAVFKIICLTSKKDFATEHQEDCFLLLSGDPLNTTVLAWCSSLKDSHTLFNLYVLQDGVK